MASSRGRASSAKTANGHNDCFVSGLDRVELVGGGNLRFVFFVMEMVDGQMQRVELPDALVMHHDALADAIGKALAALGKPVQVSANGAITVMH